MSLAKQSGTGQASGAEWPKQIKLLDESIPMAAPKFAVWEERTVVALSLEDPGNEQHRFKCPKASISQTRQGPTAKTMRQRKQRTATAGARSHQRKRRWRLRCIKMIPTETNRVEVARDLDQKASVLKMNSRGTRSSGIEQRTVRATATCGKKLVEP